MCHRWALLRCVCIPQRARSELSSGQVGFSTSHCRLNRESRFLEAVCVAGHAGSSWLSVQKVGEGDGRCGAPSPAVQHSTHSSLCYHGSSELGCLCWTSTAQRVWRKLWALGPLRPSPVLPKPICDHPGQSPLSRLGWMR